MRKTPKNMLIISFDAVGSEDLEFLKQLPNFRRFFSDAAVCEKVESVYPSVTYPAHVSIMTGKIPAHHGIINNTLVQPYRETPDWMWQSHYIQGTTLYDELRKQKKWKVGSLLWPVTAGAKIRYNLPEILPNRPWQTQELVSAYYGTAWYEIELLHKFGHLREGIKQPQLDNFLQESALHTLLRYKPDLMMVHFTDVDSNRHEFGVHSLQAKEALQRHDARLGELMEALVYRDQGIGQKVDDSRPWSELLPGTAVVILGDHYMKDTHTVVCLNRYLKDKGYFTPKDHVIRDYDAVAHKGDGSCYVYVNPRRKGQDDFLDKLRADLNDFAHCHPEVIAGIRYQDEAAKLGADPNCFCILEGQEGYCFMDEHEQLFYPAEEAKKHSSMGAHGYLPDQEGYHTFFAMLGCGIRSGAEIPYMRLIDEGPTLARLLGITLKDVDGSVMEEMLIQRDA